MRSSEATARTLRPNLASGCQGGGGPPVHQQHGDGGEADLRDGHQDVADERVDRGARVLEYGHGVGDDHIDP